MSTTVIHRVSVKMKVVYTDDDDDDDDDNDDDDDDNNNNNTFALSLRKL